MADFSGTLNHNEIYSALFNMIIGQEVFADRVSDGSELVDKAKIDAGGLFGDTKLFYSANVLHSYAWENDAEAPDLLDVARAAAPKCQAITIDQFRQICLTLDEYLSKRAWTDEGAFGQFNSVMEGMIGKSKRIHEVTLYNAYVGNAESNKGAQTQTITVASNETPENEAKKIAEKIANLLVDMTDVSTQYNDYGQVTKFAEGDIKVVWNSKFYNKIRKIDLPQIFHAEGLMDKFDNDRLPARFFGRAVAAGDIGSGKAIGTNGVYDNTKGVTLRTKVEVTMTVSNVTYELFPGDLIPNGATIGISGVTTYDVAQADVYAEDATIVCKVLVKLPPLMSGFEVGTSFFNARSLTNNRYLTWGYSKPQYLEGYPVVTLREVVSADITGAQHVIVDELPEE